MNKKAGHGCTQLFLLVLLISVSLISEAQEKMRIQSMEWGSNLKISLKLSNDSSYMLDVNQLHHTDKRYGEEFKNYTYYPARLSDEFVNQLKEIKLKQLEGETDSTKEASSKTLWSSLHHLLGGGWAHFINAILFSLEKDYLNLEAPLLKRPETNWKPKPITESYKRTRKWDYYVPINQRHAQKEYKIKKQKGELGNIEDIPGDFVDLFLETNNWEYRRMKKKGETRKLAKIDLVKLLVGANYLGKAQIEYIKTMVMKAINDYAKNELPSVIIFSNFNAAVAMSLDEQGYQVEKIVFNDEEEISDELKQDRSQKIRAIVDNINQVNKSIFQERLKKYYN
jgi:hypothetical protein